MLVLPRSVPQVVVTLRGLDAQRGERRSARIPTGDYRPEARPAIIGRTRLGVCSMSSRGKAR